MPAHWPHIHLEVVQKHSCAGSFCNFLPLASQTHYCNSHPNHNHMGPSAALEFSHWQKHINSAELPTDWIVGLSCCCDLFDEWASSQQHLLCVYGNKWSTVSVAMCCYLFWKVTHDWEHSQWLTVGSYLVELYIQSLVNSNLKRKRETILQDAVRSNHDSGCYCLLPPTEKLNFVSSPQTIVAFSSDSQWNNLKWVGKTTLWQF